MPDRREKIVRVVCMVFAAGLAFQLTVFIVRATFSRGLTVPALPSLPQEPEAQAGKNTNSPSGKISTKAGTNAPGTNAIAKGATNSASTNSVAAHWAKGSTNSVAAEVTVTNSESSNTLATATNKPSGAATQEIASAAVKISGTNALKIPGAASTNKESTNASLAKGMSKKGMPPGGRPGPGGASKVADIPAPVKERIDRIVQGEILAPVMRPLPMGLLGIAGPSAFLRGPDGQTGLVKEGDQLGTLKLLRIGTNRVLVEQDGEKKELTIFSGFGSETLLPKPDKTTNEPPKKSP